MSISESENSNDDEQGDYDYNEEDENARPAIYDFLYQVRYAKIWAFRIFLIFVQVSGKDDSFEHSRIESRSGPKLRGQYKVKLPDGRIQVI